MTKIILLNGAGSSGKSSIAKALQFLADDPWLTERLQRFKSIDPKDAEDNGALISISHPNLLELEISNLSAAKATKKIMAFIENKSFNKDAE